MADTIASRETHDGKRIYLWSDGDITWALGYSIRGVRLPRDGDLSVGWAVLGEVEIVDAADVPLLVKAAQKGGRPGEIRARFHAMVQRRDEPEHERAPTINLDWQTLETDRDGRVTLRMAKLPRMRFGSGLAIWNERGKYEVMEEVPPRGSGTYKPIGFSFSTLAAALQAASEINVA
jgi:hypothetical protein